jgi:hypothetical protein
MYRVQMPVYFFAVGEARVPQEPETMVANFVCIRYDLRRFIGQMFQEEGNAAGKFIR